MNYQNIIFDLDGTLWNSVEQIRTSWNEVISNHSEIKRGPLTVDELGQCMGLVMTDIIKKILPEECEEKQGIILKEMCEHENEYLSNHGGVLYDNVKETIEYLSVNHNLYIVSNCQDGYIEAFMNAHNMKSYFKDTECWGRTGKMKHESIQILMERNRIADAVYVGDTSGDMEAAHKAGLPFIYAAYGFGQVHKYEAKIESFNELKFLA